ncbi:hypothetical protein ACFQU7_11845 [Pseudoroseomonas wenyumeiae]
MEDAQGWTVVEPLSGRLLVARPVLVPGFDLPGSIAAQGWWCWGPSRPVRRIAAGCRRFHPIPASPSAARCWEGRAFAVTPRGLFRALEKSLQGKEKILDERNFVL